MAITKYKDADGNWQNINVKVADTLPIGSVVEYNGASVPSGWEEVTSEGVEIEISASEPVDGTKMWVQYSNNLLDFSKFEASKTLNGITFTNNNDGTITLNGTATTTTSYALLGKDNNQYELEGNYINGGINENVYMMVINRSTSGYNVIARTTNDKPTLINKSTYTTGYIELRVNAGTTLNNVVVKPMLTYDAQEKFTPYTGTTSIKVNNNGTYETIAYKNVYSTSEQIIGTFNGKPLYRKTIDLGDIPGTIGEIQLSNTTISNIETLVDINCMLYTNTFKMKLPYINLSGGSSVGISIAYQSYASPNALMILTSTSLSGYKGYASVEYTKTTD